MFSKVSNYQRATCSNVFAACLLSVSVSLVCVIHLFFKTQPSEMFVYPGGHNQDRVQVALCSFFFFLTLFSS